MTNWLIPRSKIKRMDFYFTKKKGFDENHIEEKNIEEKIIKDFKKERIKELKLKEPVAKTYWNYGDVFTDVKERIKQLKLKEPVKISSWTDEL